MGLSENGAPQNTRLYHQFSLLNDIKRLELGFYPQSLGNLAELRSIRIIFIYFPDLYLPGVHDAFKIQRRRLLGNHVEISS